MAIWAILAQNGFQRFSKVQNHRDVPMIFNFWNSWKSTLVQNGPNRQEIQKILQICLSTPKSLLSPLLLCLHTTEERGGGQPAIGSPARQLVSQLAAQLASSPTRQPVGYPARQPASQLATQPASASARQPDGRPVRQLVSRHLVRSRKYFAQGEPSM